MDAWRCHCSGEAEVSYTGVNFMQKCICGIDHFSEEKQDLIKLFEAGIIPIVHCTYTPAINGTNSRATCHVCGVEWSLEGKGVPKHKIDCEYFNWKIKKEKSK